MRMYLLLLISFLFVFTGLSSQSISQQVIATGGNFFEASNTSVSQTFGETVTETYQSSSAILTQGFQQPASIFITGFELEAIVYLEGPSTGAEMATQLNATGHLPLSQPYSTTPWNYQGTETVPAIPNADVVDWVLIELRDAIDVNSANETTRIDRLACFLLKNGSIVGLDGISNIQFNHSVDHQLYLVIWHRNHLGVLSANALVKSGNNYSYDFSTDINKAFGGILGYKLISDGFYGMAGGDSNGDGMIQNSDKLDWTSETGSKGYKSADFNLDSQVNNPDKNDSWVKNASLSSQVPQ